MDVASAHGWDRVLNVRRKDSIRVRVLRKPSGRSALFLEGLRAPSSVHFDAAALDCLDWEEVRAGSREGQGAGSAN